MVVNLPFQNEEGKQIVPKSALSELFKTNAVTPTSRNIGPPTYPVEDVVYTVGLGFMSGRYRGKHTEHTELITGHARVTVTQIRCRIIHFVFAKQVCMLERSKCKRNR